MIIDAAFLFRVDHAMVVGNSGYFRRRIGASLGQLQRLSGRELRPEKTDLLIQPA
jgi:hypothetical protein